MIRRDDGDDWLLISQVEHARLAGEIAAVWGNDEVPPLPHRDWLISAVCNHDDGWCAWEESPRIDPLSGRPREFTEMPMREATAIWTQSIEFCNRSPFGGLWVSLHFCYLAELARKSRQESAEDTVAIEQFLEEQNRMYVDSREKLTQFSRREFDRIAETGFRFLQFFDRLSLWLCCAPRTEPEEFSVPLFGSMRFVPETPELLRAEPFPFSVETLELSVPAKRIPSRRLADDDELREAISRSRTEELHWVIAPGKQR